MNFEKEWRRNLGKALEFYRQFIGPEDVAFDIGANCGGHTEIFARLAKKVVSVEPLDAIYAVLWTVFQYNEKVVPIKAACGSGFEPSMAPIMIYDPTYPLGGISSMSKEWVDAVRKSNRFTTQGDAMWVATHEVPITTLNQLIAEHGKPAFIKLDVEGYESQALCALSQPVKAMSFEFTPERLIDTFACMDHCIALGMTEFCLSIKESFVLSQWECASEVKARLKEFIGDNDLYGDVYSRLP